MKKFNVLLIGVGGQGVLSLAKLIENCALMEKYNVKGVEQHGLAQRGGSIKCHVRFSSDVIYSPMVRKGGADLVIASEILEGLRGLYYANDGTKILLNCERVIPVNSYLSGKVYPPNEEIITKIKKFCKNLFCVSASDKVREMTGEAFYTNSFLLGYALGHKLLPFKKETGLKVIKEIFKSKFLEENLRVFEAGFKR